ncbi:MAG: tRNA (adenosine(37)-N6)-threonylcarbamoyltransferase complex transferase subunit TsaD [Nitrospirae bacterium RBG_16_43_11]|nr:MAG: tRNA (adenosine(37)-N6)-threonylcarbamoyltransferase complex transferase subunit TsaD [Nitrospirae bacterium RBG_16_43_11]
MSYILAIETSCDETAAAVLEDGRKVLSSVVGFQWDIHRKYGGVVPELACRRHIEIIHPLTEEAIKKGGITLKDLDAIAVTSSPGLIGALLVGVSFAKALSYSLNIPLISVNHLEGHLWAIFLEKRVPRPFIALVVSGGHTNLYLVEEMGKYKLLGSTLDDAAGEAFDKVARVLGLGFPGGPAIELYGMKGNPDAVAFPRPLSKRKGFDFSFSGMKTAVLSYVRGMYNVAHVDDIPEALTGNDQFKADIAASFQQAIVDVLVSRTIGAAKNTGINRIVISGGVACNKLLRQRMKSDAGQNGMKVYIPSPQYCTDNAAMIAWVGYRYFKKGIYADLTLNPNAGTRIG